MVKAYDAFPTSYVGLDIISLGFLCILDALNLFIVKTKLNSNFHYRTDNCSICVFGVCCKNVSLVIFLLNFR